MFRKAPLEIVKSELKILTTIFKNTKDTVNKVSNSLLSWSYDSFEVNCGLAQTFSCLADLDFAYGQLMQHLCDRTDEYRKAIKDVQEKENDLKQLEARTSRNVRQWHQKIERIRNSGKAKENGLDLLNLAQRAEDAVNSMKQKQDEFEVYKAKTIHDALVVYTRGCLQIVHNMQIVFQCKTQISELLSETPVKADQILPDGNRIVQDAFKNVNILSLPLRDQAFDRDRFHTVAISQPILQTTTRDLPQSPHPHASTLPTPRSQGLSSGDTNNAGSVHVVTGTNNTTPRLARKNIQHGGGGVDQLYAKVSKQEKERPSRPLAPPSANLHVFHEAQSQSDQDTNNNHENEETEQEYAEPNEDSDNDYAEPEEEEELEYADPLSESDSEPEYTEVDENIVAAAKPKQIQRPTKPPPQRPTKPPPSKAHSFETAQTATWPTISKAHSFGTSSDISKRSSKDTPFYAVSSELGSSEDQDGGEIENTYLTPALVTTTGTWNTKASKGNSVMDEIGEIESTYFVDPSKDSVADQIGEIENTYFVDSFKDDSATSEAVYGNISILPETKSTIGETERIKVTDELRDTISKSHYQNTPGENDESTLDQLHKDSGDKETPNQKTNTQSSQLPKSVPDMTTDQQEGIPEYENHTFDIEPSQSSPQELSSAINAGNSPHAVKKPSPPIVKKPSPPVVKKPSPIVVKKPSPPVAKKSNEAPKPKAKPRKTKGKKTPPPVSPRR